MRAGEEPEIDATSGKAGAAWVPSGVQEIEVEVETPRGGFVKRRASGAIDFVSPLPSPFNYGFVPGTIAPDGDPWDVLVIGPPLPRGTRLRSTARARVRFTDAGAIDDKLVCKATPLSSEEIGRIEAFFRAYVRLKRGLHRWRRESAETHYDGVEILKELNV